MKKPLRLIWWATVNASLALLAWLGVNGNEGAGRVLCFAAWFFAVMAQVAASSDEIKERAQKKGRTIPAWLSHGIGIAMIVFLTWHGWWGTAIAYLLIEVGEYVTFHNPKSKDSPSENTHGGTN